MRLLDLTSQINDNLSEDRKLHDGPVNVYSYETSRGRGLIGQFLLTKETALLHSSTGSQI